MRKLLTAAAAILVLGTSSMTAGVYFDGSPGTGAPPGTLGGYTMTAFDDDTRDDWSTVSSVTGPTGDLTFGSDVTKHTVGVTWATWSHGYAGDVYHVAGNTITMTLPAGTRAFYFYSQPNQFASFDMEAISSDGTSSGTISVSGSSGARYFGFYADGGDQIAEIVVTISDADLGFGVGEFGIAGCDPVELSISLNRTVLSAPNHKMVDITATVSADGGCGLSDPYLISVTSNEPDNGADDGNTVNDIDGVSAYTEDYAFRVRNERCGSCTGRIYTVTYGVTDEFGTEYTETAEILVPVGNGGLD